MKIRRLYIPILTLIFLVLIPNLGQVSEDKARVVLRRHLEERYGETFYVGRMGRRSSRNDKEWFEADILPLRYMNTPKERDKYYWSTGTVRIHDRWWGKKLGTGGDVHMVVRLNESAAEFYKPKLDELFGDMYLPVFEIHTRYVEENGDFEVTARENISIGASFFVQGHIYIFGRINNDAERDAYKAKIYSFIDHMKETKTYEYVELFFVITDDRVLTKEFQENEELKSELADMGENNKDKNPEIFRKERRKLMSRLPEKLNYSISMKDINKFRIEGTAEGAYYSRIFTLYVYSEKFLDSRFIRKEQFLKQNGMYLNVHEDEY